MKPSLVSTFAGAVVATIVLSSTPARAQVPTDPVPPYLPPPPPPIMHPAELHREEKPIPTRNVGSRYETYLDQEDRVVIWVERNNCTKDGHLVQASGYDVMLPQADKPLTREDLLEIQQAWSAAAGLFADTMQKGAFILSHHIEVEQHLRSGGDPYIMREILTLILFDGENTEEELATLKDIVKGDPTEETAEAFLNTVKRILGDKALAIYHRMMFNDQMPTVNRMEITMMLSFAPVPQCAPKTP